MIDSDRKQIIIDIGTGIIKAGISGDDHPSYIIKTCVGRIRKDVNLVMQTEKQMENLYNHLGINAVGNECVAGIHDVTYPIENGLIKDWKGLEAILINCFHNIISKTTIEDYSIIVTDSVYGMKQSRFDLARLLFKVFGAKSFYINYQPFFSFFSLSNKNSGIIIEIGDGLTQVYPCVGGYPLRRGIRKYPFGGSIINDYLFQKLNYTDLNSKSHMKDISEIKEKYCEVLLNYQEDRDHFEPKKIEEFNITIGSELIDGPEMFFQSTNNKYEKGIHEIIHESIQDCAEKYHKCLYNNIILCGGLTKMKGFRERLEKELKILAPDENINIISLPNPSESAWLGASNFGSFYSFDEFEITKEEYEQYGDSIIDEKCYSLDSKNN